MTLQKQLTSSSCFCWRSLCFSCKPSRTCFAARFRSACRTVASPLPSFALPAASKTRPARAFFLFAGAKSRSGLREPDSSLVCTRRCNKASFWVFVLQTDQLGRIPENRCSAHRSSSSSSEAAFRRAELDASCASFVTLDDYVTH